MINYIIACWSGMRRVNPEQYINNRSIFLEKHLELLSILKHSINQITLVINYNQDEPQSYRNFINNIPKTIGSSKVEIIERPNIGFSYGGYSDAFKQYKEDFKYYMLMEDDYTFLVDDFDQIMISQLESNDRYGFATFCLSKNTRKRILSRVEKLDINIRAETTETINRIFPKTFKYPRVAVGLARSTALTATFNEFGELPHAKGDTHGGCKLIGQFGLSAALQKVKWKLIDVNQDYKITAYSPKGEILEEGQNDKPLILAPIQSLIST